MSRLVTFLAFVSLVVGSGACGSSAIDLSDAGFSAAADGGAFAVDGGTSGDGGNISRDGGDGDGGVAPPDAGPPTLLSLTVDPALVRLAVGTAAQLTLTGVYSSGATIDLTSEATWSVDDGRVAAVAAAGLVRALAPGETILRAAARGLGATTTVAVTAATIRGLALTPASARVGIGGSITFRAVATLSDGTTQELFAPTVAWSTSDGALASIAQDGVVTGLRAGSTTITATVASANVNASAILVVDAATLRSIAVTPTAPTIGAGVSVTFTATGTYSDGSIADVSRTATWTSSDTNVAVVVAGGAATTRAPGTAVIAATVGDVAGRTTLLVTAATVRSLAITPASIRLAPGATQPLTATATYSDGATADVTRTVAWTSSAADLAAVSNADGSQGVVTARAAGDATITARFGGVTATALVTVLRATLVSLAITPADAMVPLLASIPLTARGTYSDGTVLDVTTSVSWSVDDATIASISNATGAHGVVSGVGRGSTTVRALLGGVTGTSRVTVSAAALIAITIIPADLALETSVRTPLRALGTYSDQTTVDLTNTAVWTSADSRVATVSNASGAQGQLTTLAVGTTTITATSSGISGTARVAVTAPTLSELVVSPIAPSVALGQNLAVSATAIFSNGTQQNVTQQVTWQSSNTAVAVIGPNGGVQTRGAGTTMLSATYRGLTASTTLTVTDAAPIELQVSPIAPAMAVGTTLQFQAIVVLSDQSTRNVTPLATWTSSTPSVLAIATGGGGGPGGGQAGVARALAAGTATITAAWSGLSAATGATVTAAVPVSISVSPASVSAPVGASRQFSATVIYSDGTSRDVTALATWRSSSASIVGVNDAAGGGGPGGGGGGQRGLATALSIGSASISATFSGLTGSGTFTVTAATLSSVAVTPIAPSVSVGTPIQFVAIAIFSDNTQQNVTGAATWTSSAGGVVAVSNALGARGIAQTLSAGSATITATWNGVSGSTLATVTPATLLTIQITPFAPTLPVGFAARLVATGIYSDNTTQDLTALATWTSSNNSVAAVSTAGGTRGLVTPLSAGGATIRATYQGVTGTDAVTVIDAVLRSIAITPAAAAVRRLASQAFTAVGTFSDGSTLEVTNYVTWLSDTPSIADVSNAAGSQGVAKGLAVGSVTITAVRSDIRGAAMLTVTD